MTSPADLAAQGRDVDAAHLAATSALWDQVAALPVPAPPAPPAPVAGLRRPDLYDPERNRYPGQTITKSGTVLENGLITGPITIGSNVKDWAIVNCVGEIAGAPPGSYDRGLVHATASGAEGGWYEGCDMRPLVPHPRWESAFYGRNATIIGVRARGVVDGFSLVAGSDGWVRVTAIDTLSEDHAWFADDPAHSDGSHPDGFQIHGPAGVRVKGVTIVRPVWRLGPNGTSGIMCNTPGGIEQLTITRAAGTGGRSDINFTKYTPYISGSITWSRFATPYPIFALTTAITNLRIEGNTRPDGVSANTVSKP